MVDIVSVNGFAFTPSAFIAAYVEEIKTDISVTEITANSGTLSTVPNSTGTIDMNLATALISANAAVATAGKATISIPSIPTSTDQVQIVNQNYPGAYATTIISNPTVLEGIQGVVGVASPGSGPTTTFTGSVIDFLGQSIADTRTVTKTITSSSSWVVVLVLSYGTFKTHIVDRSSGLVIVSDIYTQVQAYLQSL
jgi:hypothetical protein